MLTDSIETWIRRLVLLLMLPLSCLAGNVAPYVAALALIGLFLILLFQRRLVPTYRELLPALLVTAFLVLGACFALTAEEPRDVVSTFNFVMLLLSAPLVHAMAKGASRENATRVAWLALAGAALALAIVSFQLMAGVARGTWITLGPIRIANTAVVLGFLAMIGWFTVATPVRWVFTIGPVLGVAVTLLTQSRGPLAAVALSLPVAFFFVLGRLPRRMVPVAIVVAAVVVALGLAAIASQERLAALPDVIRGILAGEEVADFSTRMRLLLYEAAIEAFWHAPWIGYGWHDMMEAVIPYLHPDTPGYARRLPQLHNDVLDFAVAAGTIGVLVYLLLIGAPIAAALRSARDSQRTARLYGASVLVCCYLGAGLTDLMFGFEFHTALYVALAAVIIGYCRDEPR